jgi:hypothetical protein
MNKDKAQNIEVDDECMHHHMNYGHCFTSCNPDEHIPQDRDSDANDPRTQNLEESQVESSSTERDESESLNQTSDDEGVSLLPVTHMPGKTSSTEDDTVMKIGALEKKLAEFLEFKRKLEVATNKTSGVNDSVEDLMVLILSRGETPVGTRPRNLAKQWKSAQSKLEVWRDEWDATKQELRELRNQLKLVSANVDSSESEEEEEIHICCAGKFCVFDELTIHNVKEAHLCSICCSLCHIDCATKVEDAGDEIACNKCIATCL